jgi:NodT family efflux transporter outer membrane factor (OMF) lipoprotein
MKPQHRHLPPVLRTTTMVACMTALSACAVGPEYRNPPTIATGNGWIQPADAEAGVAPLDLSRWWTALGDPTLDRLVEQALAQNLDVRQAASRIAESRAALDAARGSYAPAVNAKAGVTRREQSLNGALPIGEIPGIERRQTIYEPGFDAAWEIDLFGGTRRAVESAQASLQASEADAAMTRISIAAETARTYLTLRGTQKELAARTASVAALRQIRDLTVKRAQSGDLASADVDTAQASLDEAAAALPPLQAQRHAAVVSLGLLSGGLPEREVALENEETPEVTLSAFPVGERADLLRRRPDVRAAERRLAASSANIGIATAELFPKLSINASGGFQSISAGNVFDGGSRNWSVAPLVSWRIFDGGRVRAEIRAAEAREQTAALAYEEAVLAALNDAEQQLAHYRYGLDATASQTAALASARRAYEHARNRYAAGDVSLIDVLNAERTLRDAENNEASTRTSTAIHLVALCKALGGGWSS